MRKKLLFLILAIVACGVARSQTELYKQMARLNGLTASCIENYPIGDSLRVSVTILEASDTAIYDNMVKIMRETVEIQDTALWARMALRVLKKATLPEQEDSHPLPTLVDRFPPSKTMTIKLFIGQMNTEAAKQCLVYCVKEWRTILVFHCHDEVRLGLAFEHTLSLITSSAKSMKDQD